MAAAKWGPNGGILNSYRATIGRYTWVLRLLPIGWVMENQDAPAYAPVFVAPVTEDAENALGKATTKALRAA